MNPGTHGTVGDCPHDSSAYVVDPERHMGILRQVELDCGRAIEWIGPTRMDGELRGHCEPGDRRSRALAMNDLRDGAAMNNARRTVLALAVLVPWETRTA